MPQQNQPDISLESQTRERLRHLLAELAQDAAELSPANPALDARAAAELRGRLAQVITAAENLDRANV